MLHNSFETPPCYTIEICNSRQNSIETKTKMSTLSFVDDEMTMEKLRCRIKTEHTFQGILTSVRGRSKQMLIAEMNERIRRFRVSSNDCNASPHPSKNKKRESTNMNVIAIILWMTITVALLGLFAKNANVLIKETSMDLAVIHIYAQKDRAKESDGGVAEDIDDAVHGEGCVLKGFLNALEEEEVELIDGTRDNEEEDEIEMAPKSSSKPFLFELSTLSILFAIQKLIISCLMPKQQNKSRRTD